MTGHAMRGDRITADPERRCAGPQRDDAFEAAKADIPQIRKV
jgi:hypothetical protein